MCIQHVKTSGGNSFCTATGGVVHMHQKNSLYIYKLWYVCAVAAVLVNRTRGVLVDPPSFAGHTAYVRLRKRSENRLPPRAGVGFFVTLPPETVRASSRPERRPKPKLTDENTFRRNIITNAVVFVTTTRTYVA